MLTGHGKLRQPEVTPESRRNAWSGEGAMLRDMKTRTHLKPGQKGTRRLVEKYGKALLCVRYRYDKSRGVMLKTVEIVEEQKPWPPSHKYHDEDIVAVTVLYKEKAL